MADKTLVFFGAGSTFELGAPVTAVQEEFLKSLVKIEIPVEERLEVLRGKKGFKWMTDEEWKDFVSDIKRTLCLLYDGDGSQKESSAEEKREKAERELKKTLEFRVKEGEIEQFLRVYIYPWYDWLAFVGIAKSLFSTGEGVTIQDVLSVFVKAHSEEISLPTSELFKKEKEKSLSVYVNYPSRLEGALRVYKLLIFKLFKHLLRSSVVRNKNLWKKYENFSADLVKEFIKDFDVKVDVSSSVMNLAMATLNWDPIFPMFFIKACKEINDSLIKENKRIYLSYGAPFLVRKFSPTAKDEGLYIFGEEAVTLVNAMTLDKKKCNLKMKTLKFFVPHGLMNLRVCPRCQNAFIILPDDVGKLSWDKFLDIYLLDPLPSMADVERMKMYSGFFKNRNPSHIDCPVCHTPTYFHDTFMLIQSIVKPKNVPIMEKVAVDYCVNFSEAEHLVFLGYSFPIDDIPHMLSLLTIGTGLQGGYQNNKKFTIVLFNEQIRTAEWVSVDYAKKHLSPDSRDIKTIEALLKLAKRENIRLNFVGIPKIFKVHSVADIATWRKPYR